MKILIIDDNPDITSLFSDILESEGYHSKIVNNAKEGLDLIKSDIYNTIFLDIAMPELSGIEILEKLDTEGILKTKNIVLFTATPISESELNSWKDKGLHGIIRKPARLAKILEMLESLKAK